MDTGEEREYTPDLRFRSPQWSPGGSSILLRGRDAQGQRLSSRIDLETGRVSPMLVNRWGSWIVTPRWSADGSAVYYIEPWDEGTGRPARIMRRDLATGQDEEIRLLPEGVTTGQVLPSPDGRWLALALNRNGRHSVAIMPVSGTEIRELLDHGPMTLAWAPDSQQILFFRPPRTERRVGAARRSELWGVPVQGGDARSFGLSVPFPVENLSIHPDGRQIAFQVRERTTEIWAMENFLPDVQGGQ